MARVIEGNVKRRAPGRAAKYLWAEWFDGQSREMIRGDDFSVDARVFRCIASSAARSRGKKLVTSVIDDNTVHIQAFDRD